MVFYCIVDSLILSIAFAIVISTTLCHKDPYGGNRISNYLSILIGMAGICALYVAFNYIDTKSIEIVLSGIGKSLILYYMVNNVSSLHDFHAFSLVAMVVLVLISIYESLIISTTLLSNITLFIIIGILSTRLFKKQNWST